MGLDIGHEFIWSGMWIAFIQGGANSIQLEAGLGKATKIESIEVSWYGNPKNKQVFKNVGMDQIVKLTEGMAEIEKTGFKATPLQGKSGGKSCCK